ncbi:hypothetical protein BC830DRAFT_1175513, partial [Chytriomyces sp. MP71]
MIRLQRAARFPSPPVTLGRSVSVHVPSVLAQTPAAKVLQQLRDNALARASPASEAARTSLKSTISSTLNTLDSDPASLSVQQLLVVVAHPNLVKIDHARLAKLLHLLVTLKTRFVPSAQHFNLLLTHLLQDYIDAVQTPYQPLKNPQVTRAGPLRGLDTPIDPETASLGLKIFETLDTLHIQSDGWTYSLRILLHMNASPQILSTIWNEYCDMYLPRALDAQGISFHSMSDASAVYDQTRLQPWAYNALFHSFSVGWFKGQRMYDPSIGINLSKVGTHQHKPTESTQTPSMPSSPASLIWSIYSHMKKSGVKPTLHTHESLLRAMLSIRPLDFKAIRKARAKLVPGQKYMAKIWRVSTFEAAMEAVAECGTDEEVEKLLDALDRRGIQLTRPLADSLMKFHALNGNHAKALEIHASTSHLPATHSTFTSLLESLSAASPDAVDSLVTKPLSLLLVVGSDQVGPTTFDLLFTYLLAHRDFPRLAGALKTLEETLIPAWRAKKVYGFSHSASGDVILGLPVVESIFAQHGHKKD